MTGAIRIGVLWVVLSFSVALPSFGQERYRRASLTQIMIEHPMYPFNEEIVDAFKSMPLSVRFNNHDLGVRTVKFATQEYTDQTPYIQSFLSKAKVGTRAVAKWFMWDKETGEFSMDLVRKRGLYDASNLDRDMAARKVRGSSILEDAGENLIPHTYLIMHDICFSGDYSNRRADNDRIGMNVSFSVEVTSYIFSLDWSVDLLDEFYAVSYTHGNRNFIADGNYLYRFCAKVSSTYSESSKSMSQKNLIKQVVGRCLDINIAKLQTAYPDFRIRIPVSSVDPFMADVGLKEGLTENSRFEVLEVEVDSNGIASYHRVGIVRPRKGRIADNRYTSDGSNAGVMTEFVVEQGSDFYAGMLIREI